MIHLTPEKAINALSQLEDDEATLPNCYKALIDATEGHTDGVITPYKNLIEAWRTCAIAIDNEYAKGIVAACTAYLYYICLKKVNADEKDIKEMKDTAIRIWKSI